MPEFVFLDNDISDEPTIPDFVEPQDVFSPGQDAVGDVFSEPESAPTTPLGVDLGGDSDSERTERTPARQPRRKSVADLFTLVWGGAGMAMEQTLIDPPVGRVMQFQAPLAGQKFDEFIAHSWLDAILQPFVSKGDSGRQILQIVGLPLVIGLMERGQNNPVVMGIAHQLLEANMTELVPVIKAKKRKAEKNAEAMADLTDMFDIPEGMDPVEALFASIFAPPPDRPVRQPSGEPTGTE
jgi:hypothetical protein